MNKPSPFLLAGVIGSLVFTTAGWLGYRAMQERTTPAAPPSLASSTAMTPEQAKAAVEAIFALSLPDTEGRPQAMAQWRNKILVVNYWATWCPPCLQEMPAFSRLHSHYAAWGVQFVGIGLDEADKIRDFAKSTPVSYPLLVAGATTQAPGLQVKGLPYTLVIGPDGHIETAHLGRLDETRLEPILHKLTKK